MEDKEKELKQTGQKMLIRMNDLKEKIAKLSKRKEKEMKAEFADLEKEVNELSKGLVCYLSLSLSLSSCSYSIEYRYK